MSIKENTGTCRWVSVEETPLLKDGYVFVANRDGIHEAFYSAIMQRWHRLDLDSHALILGVTHWLEVIPPDPPKKKVKKEIMVDLIHKYLDGSIEFRAKIPKDAANVKLTYEVEE